MSGPAPEGRPARSSSRLRTWAFRLASVVLAPALFFGLLELALRLSGYGYPTDFLVRSADAPGACVANEKFGWRFFPPAIARKPVPCILPATKAGGTCRIFVLGSSAAMGTPDPTYSLGRVLQVMLQETYPGTRFEVVNAAMTAVNSHVIRDIAADCARHEPDLFIIYMGNNEVVGPYGPGTAFAAFLPSLTAIRASLWVKSTRVGQLMADLLASLRAKDTMPQWWVGMEMFSQNTVAADDPKLARTYEYFRANLDDICRTGRRAGAGVVVCTVAANLKDCAPFASLHRAGLDESDKARWEQLYHAGAALEKEGRHAEAIDRYAAAAGIDGRFADLQFRMARCHAAAGRHEEARGHYALARDLDALRFRADSRINEAVRDVAKARSADGVKLADAVRAFEESGKTPHGVPGEELFHEHVHTSFDGTYLLARCVFEQVKDLLPERVRGRQAAGAAPPGRDLCAARLALTVNDEYQTAADIAEMVARPPFTGQIDHAADLARRLRRVEELDRLRTPENLERATHVYRQALERAPDDWMIRVRFGVLLEELRDYDGAVRQWEQVPERFPTNVQARTMIAGALLKAGKAQEAADFYREAIRLEPSNARAHKGLGNALARLEKPAEAAAEFQAALGLKPDFADAHTDLAIALLMQNKVEEAAAHFKEAVRLKPGVVGHYNLGGLLMKQRKLDEAAAEFEAALAIAPDHAESHNNLGMIRMARGAFDEAAKHFAAAVRAKPDYAAAYGGLGDSLAQLGRTEEAVAAYRRLTELRPDSPMAMCRLAWILATSKDEAVRDPAEAVRLAEEAVRRVGARQPEALDTLAAAYAAAGRLDEAVKTASAAIRLARETGQAPLAAQIAKHLDEYKAGRPYRAPPGTLYP